MLTQDFKKKQTEISGDLAKYQTIDKDTVSISMFKKVNKKDLIAQLTQQNQDVNYRSTRPLRTSKHYFK